MARAEAGGWDFVKAGQSYQYKEDRFIAKVTILEDYSTQDFYKFKLQTEESNIQPPTESGVFEISQVKNIGGIYSGMLQIYEKDAYNYTPTWKKPETVTKINNVLDASEYLKDENYLMLTNPVTTSIRVTTLISFPLENGDIHTAGIMISRELENSTLEKEVKEAKEIIRLKLQKAIDDTYYTYRNKVKKLDMNRLSEIKQIKPEY